MSWGGGWNRALGGNNWRGGGRGSLAQSDENVGKAFDWRLMKRLIGYMGPYKPRVGVGLFAMLLLEGTNIAQPLLEGWAIDRVVAGQERELIILSAIYLVTLVVAWLSQYQQTYQMTWVGQYVLYDLASDMFKHIMRLSLSFFDKNETGRIMSRVQNDVQVLQQLLARGFVSTVGDVVVLSGILVTMFIIDWRLAALTSLCLPIFLVVLLFWQKIARRNFQAARATISVVNASLQENVSGVRVIQSLGREGRNFRQFSDANTANLDANLGAGRVSAATAPLVEIIQSLALALVIFFGGGRVVDGALTVGLLYTFIRYVNRFFEPIRTLLQEYNQFQRGTVAMERIFEIIDTEEEIKDAPDAFELPPLSGAVTYDHVRFGYVPGLEILHDFNLDIRPGERVAFVGQTGAGKSTLISLLVRFYDVTGGAVRIDGHDVRDVTMQSLRRQIGIVLQDAVLFTGTIADNIRYARPEATDEQVREAARTVGAAEIIERMPLGYATPVHERGVGLSLGERQLIAFARALLADPRILVLDEATANLDTATEAIVQRGIRGLTAGRTSLIIAHRLSTVRDADRIVVLEEGRIAEHGTHDELIALGGVYSRLYSLGFEQEARANGTGAILPANAPKNPSLG